MSTRACIHVTKNDAYPDVMGSQGLYPNPNNGPKEAQYYHHWDGYPTGLGLELAMTLVNFHRDGKLTPGQCFREIKDLFRSTFTHEYEAEKPGSWHGDLEYVYHINFDEGVRLSCHSRPMNDETPRGEHENWRDWHHKTLLHIALRERDGKSWYVLNSLHVEEF